MGYLLLAFCLIPILELWLLIRIGSVLGASSTILLVLTTGVVGVTLARSQGLRVLIKAQEALDMGQPPSEALFDGVCILVGGLLLLTPGFLTDAVGFCLLLPSTRMWFKSYLRYKIEQAFQQGQTIRIYRSGP